MHYYRLMDCAYKYLFPECCVFRAEGGCPDAIIKHACATHNYML